MYNIKSNDITPKNIPATKIDQVLHRNKSETRGLAGILKIKVNAQVMLTVNIELQDRLINGQLGTVKHISKDRNGNVAKIYVQFDDPRAGLKIMSTDAFAKSHFWVPIEKSETNIKNSIKEIHFPNYRKNTNSFHVSMDMYCA